MIFVLFDNNDQGGSKMKRKSWVIASALTLILASCAVITVNIYFPEKDVKEAYKTLEKELMSPEEKMPKDKDLKNEPAGKPEGSLRFEFISTAYAQEPGLAEKIAETVKKMPDVVNAYKEMGSRIADTDRLRDGGLVGEGKDGYLVPREKTLSSADQKIIATENENRKTVINGMARAIVRINRLQETPENLKQVLPQAAAQFAAIRRDSAKKGWWIQNTDGNWGRK
jgi:uncharacterized protein YdbL (DUF1318 family)